MNKILFLYNDMNNVKGISDVMLVAERFASQSGYGNFIVDEAPKPAINFEDGSSVAIRPISKGVSDFKRAFIIEFILMTPLKHLLILLSFRSFLLDSTTTRAEH